MLPMVLLAGGKATRLGNLTIDKAKSLIEINGRPFIDYQLRSFSKNGFTSVIICVGKFADQIVDYVGDGSRFNLDIRYSFDGLQQKGTGGALKHALPMLDSDFFLQYGDSFLNLNYFQMETEFKRKRTPCLMSIYRNRGEFDKSNVRVQSGHGIIYSKYAATVEMDYIDYGCLVFERQELMKYESPLAFDLSEYLEYLSIQGVLEGFKVQNRFFEIGSFEGIQEFTHQVRSNLGDF